MNEEISSYDVIVIGAGAAGCSAAIYATRYAMKTLLIGGPMPGGLISEAIDVENYPGFVSISGMELAQNFLNQAKTLGAEYSIETVEQVTPRGNSAGFEVKTSAHTYSAKSVILATGTHHRTLGVPGEAEFVGKGVSYCATCDAPFYKGKTVAVIGGGNSAVDGAQSVSLPGVFCAGDLTNASNQLHQQITSASEGAIAAQSAYRYIHGLDYVIREE